MPTSASGSYSLPTLRFQNLPPRAGQTLHGVLGDMATGIRQARIQGGGGGGAGSITTGQIASFTACVGDVLATAIVAGNGLTLSAGTHTVELKVSAVSTSQINSFTASVQDVIGIGLAAGTNITLSINATTKVVEIINSAALTGTVTAGQILSFTESVQDIIGAFLVAGTNVNFTYSDVANQLTINATASGGAASTLAGLTFTATGSGASPISALEKMRQIVYVEDFGAVGDAVTDDHAAFMAAINWQTDLEGRGVKVYLKQKDYFIGQTLNLKRPVHLIGEYGLEGEESSRLLFPAGVDGIIINHGTSHGPVGTLSGSTTLSMTTDAAGTHLDGIWVAQNGTRYNLVVLDFDAGRNLVCARVGGNLSAITITASTTIISMADAGTVAATYVLSQQWTSHCTLGLLDPPTSFTTSETVVGSVSGVVGIIRYISPFFPAIGVEIISGSTFTRTDVLTGAVTGTTARCWSIGSSDTIVYSSTGGGSFGVEQLLYKQSDHGSGIRFRDRATVNHCRVHNFTHHGIVGVHSSDNMNLIKVEHALVSNCGGHGIILGGTDANACTVFGCSVTTSGGWGINDNAFLGNHHYSNHVSGMGIGAYRSGGSSGAFSVWSGCYSEGGGSNFPYWTYRESFNEGPTIIGGDHGAPIMSGNANDRPGTYNSYTRPTQLLGRTFQLGRAIELDGNLSANGLFDSDSLLRFWGSVGETAVIEIAALGSRGDAGGRIQFGLDLTDNQGIRGVHRDPVFGGRFGMNWSGGNRDDSFYRFSARPIPFGGTLGTDYVLRATKTSTYTGSGAVFVPIISGGLCVGVEIANPGRDYSLPPKIEGVGGLASICATCQVYGGEVISAGLVAGTTFTATSNTPQTCLDFGVGYKIGFCHSLASSYEFKVERFGGSGPCDMYLNPANGGRLMFGTFTSTATLIVTGYIEIKDASGTLRKLAIIG